MAILRNCTRFTQGGVKRHLAWLYRLTTSYPRRTIAAVFIFLALSAASLLSVRFESDVFKLFPAQQGALRLFLDSLDWTGSAKEAYFLLEGEPALLPSEAESFARRLESRQVDGAPAFRRVTYRVYDQSEAQPFADFLAYAVTRPQIFLAPAELPAYLSKLSPKAMDASLQRGATELASQAGMGMGSIIAADPLYLRELILPRLKQGSQALAIDSTSPYFLSRDGKLLIMVAEPARPVQDMAFARKLVAGINQAKQGAKVRITCTGAHLNAVIDEAVMKRNIISCVLSSLVVVLALFYGTYRRVLPTLLLPVILCGGVLPALAVAGLFLSSIHIISFAFMALIIGLGTDYSIHLYDRFYTERTAGRGFDDALRLAVEDTGHGVFTAAATTALPFLTFTISDVRALSELGLLVGLGVIFSMYATFLLLPPLLILVERHLPSSAYKPLPAFFLGGVWQFARRHALLFRCGSLLLVLLLLLTAGFISFEGDLKNLQPRQSEAFLTQEKIERHLSLSPKQMLVAVEGTALADVLARGARVNSLAERYRQQGGLAAFSSLGQVINDPLTQRELSGRLAEGVAGNSPEKEFLTALARHGFTAEPFRQTADGLAGLAKGGTFPAGEAIERLAASPLRGVVERHLIKTKDGYHLLFYLFYKGAEFNQAAFMKELASIDPTARSTSVDLVSEQLSASVRQSFIKGFIIGGLLVAFLLLSHFESAAGLFYSLYPVAAGVVAMLGLMVITGMKLNFMNSMVLVTIIGMGSDYGLHIGHRVAWVEEPDRQGEFTQAGRAVFLSALTTIAGFGSLAFADYGALASIGWATNYGVGATALFTLVSLPAFLNYISSNTAKK